MNIVILAAGMGKRMYSSLPKVLHPLAGKPMLSHVLDTARALQPKKITVVYGHGGELVKERMVASDVVFAKQEKQLGTGHAVLQAVPELDETVPTLVLYGDCPLIGKGSLERLAVTAGTEKLGVLTVELNNPTGYGRIIREAGKIVRIVEQKDGKILVVLKSGEQLTCDYLIGADGANSQVRKQLTGLRLNNSLWMERYVKKGANEFIFEFSNRYKRGYSFSFPNLDWDIVGMGGLYTSLEDLRSHQYQSIIKEEVSENDSVLRGAYISVETVESGKNHVILIGDAGGFANKLTYEGLYYAIATGRNAYRAIVDGQDFAITNRKIFRKKRKEVWMTRLFYSRFGLWLMKLGAHSPKLIKKAFELNY